VAIALKLFTLTCLYPEVIYKAGLLAFLVFNTFPFISEQWYEVKNFLVKRNRITAAGTAPK
jgi:hypothetical protein